MREITQDMAIIKSERLLYIRSLCSENDKILDIGSHDGHLFFGWDRKNIVSIDLDIYNIENFISANAEDLPFKDKVFDIAVLGEVLEHCSNGIKVLQEAKRVAKKIIITVPYEHKWDDALLPFNSQKKEMERTGLNKVDLAKLGNSATYDKDGYAHLYHNIHYTPALLKEHLEEAFYVDFVITERYFNEYVYLTVVTNTEEENNMNFVGTILVGARKEGLKRALESFNRCGVDAIFALIDTIDINSMDLLKQYNCHIFEKEWDWNLGASRTFLSSKLPPETKMEIFLDTDDEIPEESAKIVRDIVTSGKEVVIKCPYIYMEDGLPTFSIERIRMYPPPAKWFWHCHEVPIYQKEIQEYKMADLKILHHFDGHEAQRNIHYIEGLLKDLDNKELDRSRTLYFLGQSYFSEFILTNNNNDQENALKYYEEYLSLGGWDEERMKACMTLSQIYQNKNDVEKAMQMARQASNEVNHKRREPLLRLSEILLTQQKYKEGLDIIENAIQLPVPDNVMIQIPPYCYPYDPLFRKADMLRALNNIELALDAVEEGLKYYPNSVWGRSFFDHYKNIKIAMHGKEQSETKIQPISSMNYNQVPNDRLIYFYLGKAPQQWNASSINNRGIGGRETATVHLAQELKKYGWCPVLFADCSDMNGMHEGLQHLDYTKFDEICQTIPPKFIISSMSSTIVDNNLPNAVKILWCHDAGFGDDKSWNYLSPERRDKWDAFIFGCPSHLVTNKEWYKLPTEKCKIINLGIYLDRFAKNVIRDRYKIVYTSSPDRGLERLLSYWSDIKGNCPKATLHIYYGFDNMKAYGISPEWVDHIYYMMSNLDGVRFHGRLPQKTLAEELLSASIWAYPTHFWETTCISALEASAAGLAMVTTDLGALHTTVSEHGILIHNNCDSLEYKEEYINHIVRLLKDDQYLAEWQEKARNNIHNRFNENGDLLWEWESVGKLWDTYLRELTLGGKSL
jgi:glycosyltransferase involved in cell wall biosynthesis